MRDTAPIVRETSLYAYADIVWSIVVPTEPVSAALAVVVGVVSTVVVVEGALAFSKAAYDKEMKRVTIAVFVDIRTHCLCCFICPSLSTCRC
jgi:hypothetical protein